MKYFVFDMDETLAELYSVYYFVASLRLQEILKEENRKLLAPEFETSLNKAYRKFVSLISREESSNQPLGILRPGILQVMDKLNDLQRLGKIENVIIYSNNGHLQSLEFIRDVIHNYLGNSTLIKDCIHWNHPMRNEERTSQVGAANKTWNVLRNIMIKGDCNAPEDLEPEDVCFFDDLDHRDLKAKLGQNYYQVPAYNFKASFDRIANIYFDSIEYADVNNRLLVKYILDTFTDIKNGQNKYLIWDVIRLFEQRTKGTAGLTTLPPPPDEGIEMIMEAIKRILQYGGNKRRRLFFVTTKHAKKRRFRRKNNKRSTRKKN